MVSLVANDTKRSAGVETAACPILLCLPHSLSEETVGLLEHSERSLEVLSFLNSLFDSLDTEFAAQALADVT